MKHWNEITDILNRSNHSLSRSVRKPSVPKVDGYVCGFNSMLKQLLTPDRIIEHWDNIEYGNKKHVTIGIVGYPGKVRHGWLYGLVERTDNVKINFSQFIEPVDSEMAAGESERFLNIRRHPMGVFFLSLSGEYERNIFSSLPNFA